LQWFGHIFRKEKEGDIKRVHEMRVKGKRNWDSQSLYGRTQSGKISKADPLMKKMLRTGLDEEA